MKRTDDRRNNYSSFVSENKPQPKQRAPQPSEPMNYQQPATGGGPPKPWSPNSAVRREKSREEERSAEAERYRSQVRTATDAMQVSPTQTYQHETPPPPAHEENLHYGGMNNGNMSPMSPDSMSEDGEVLAENFREAFTASSDEALL